MISVQGKTFSHIYLQLLKLVIELNPNFVQSRIGLVRDMGPTTLELTSESFRFPLLVGRGFNPYFALTEFSWMITGSNKVEPLRFFIRDYDKYSDDGKTLNGAYGYRLRYQFDFDQLERSISIIKMDPTSRRVVISLWSHNDLGSNSKDIPCNTSIMLKVRDHKLDLTVINRSNDLFLGLPYNVVIFNLLQNHLANQIGCAVGKQVHFIDSLHLYEKHLDKVHKILKKNNSNSIDIVFNNIPNFNLAQYVHEEHSHLLSHKYDKIKNVDINKLFESYLTYRNGQNVTQAIQLLPHNLLGYAGYLWLTEHGSYDNSVRE